MRTNPFQVLLRKTRDSWVAMLSDIKPSVKNVFRQKNHLGTNKRSGEKKNQQNKGTLPTLDLTLPIVFSAGEAFASVAQNAATLFAGPESGDSSAAPRAIHMGIDLKQINSQAVRKANMVKHSKKYQIIVKHSKTDT